MKATALGLTLALLAGCAAPAVSISQGQAALLYADAREFYGRVTGPLELACQGQRVPPALCADLKRLQERLGTVDPQIRQALLNPKAPVDFATLEKMFGSVLTIGGMVGRLYGLPIP